MIPAAFTEASAHVLNEGANRGKPLGDLDDATLAAVVKWYRSRDFYEWRAAMLTANARVLERLGLLEAPRSHLESVAQRRDGDAAVARWYLENFGTELA